MCCCCTRQACRCCCTGAPFGRPLTRFAPGTSRPACVCSERVYGVTAPVLNPALALLQVLLLGPFGPQRNSLVWVCDAYRLIERGQVDWDAFAACLADGAALLPVLLVLEYLVEALHCAVPVEAMAGLRNRWPVLRAPEQAMAREVLLFALLQHGAVTREQMWREAATVPEKLRVARAVLTPAARVLRRTEAIERTGQAPWYWLRQVSRAVRWGVRGRSASGERQAAASPDFRDGSESRGNVR